MRGCCGVVPRPPMPPAGRHLTHQPMHEELFRCGASPTNVLSLTNNAPRRTACSPPPTRGGAAATAPPSSCTPGGCWQVRAWLWRWCAAKGSSTAGPSLLGLQKGSAPKGGGAAGPSLPGLQRARTACFMYSRRCPSCSSAWPARPSPAPCPIPPQAAGWRGTSSRTRTSFSALYWR